MCLDELSPADLADWHVCSLLVDWTTVWFLWELLFSPSLSWSLNCFICALSVCCFKLLFFFSDSGRVILHDSQDTLILIYLNSPSKTSPSSFKPAFFWFAAEGLNSRWEGFSILTVRIVLLGISPHSHHTEPTAENTIVKDVWRIPVHMPTRAW